MHRPRVIPVLLLRGEGLYKTQTFKNPVYVGDPVNTVRIFNDKEVDELIILDTQASERGQGPNYALIETIVSESFMPVAYGGGVSKVEEAMKLFALGIEKVIINSAAFFTPNLISDIARNAGSQAVVASIDVKSSWLGAKQVYVQSGRKATGMDPVSYAKKMVALGAGELMMTSIAQEGTMKGYDLELIQSVAEAVEVPVIAHGGAGSLEDLRKAIHIGQASAVAAGSLFVFQGPHRAVLISYPAPGALEEMAA